jgi:hypothetical protein
MCDGFMKILPIIGLMLLMIFSSGCTQQASHGLSLSLQPDPQTIFAGSPVTLHVDLSNDDVKTLEKVTIDVFDTGILKAPQDLRCAKAYDRILPNQFETFSCVLQSPHITENEISNDLYARTAFTTEFSAAQVLELMSEDEYNNRLASGTYQEKPKSYSYRDKYVQMDIDFSDPVPMVFRQGQRFFVYFTIRNAGNGFIEYIEPEEFYIEQQGDLIECNGKREERIYPTTDRLEPIGDVFPRLGCEILLPNDLTYMGNYQMIIHFRYYYEIRDKTTVRIMR